MMNSSRVSLTNLRHTGSEIKQCQNAYISGTKKYIGIYSKTFRGNNRVTRMAYRGTSLTYSPGYNPPLNFILMIAPRWKILNMLFGSIYKI